MARLLAGRFVIPSKNTRENLIRPSSMSRSVNDMNPRTFGSMASTIIILYLIMKKMASLCKAVVFRGKIVEDISAKVSKSSAD